MLYIKSLPEIEKQTLEELQKNSLKKHLRDRCQCMLLSNRGFSVNELARIFQVRTRTIYTWIHLYEDQGFFGLKIKPGRGVKSLLNDLITDQIADIREEVRLNPQNLQGVAAILSEKFGFKMTKPMLKKFLKKN